MKIKITDLARGVELPEDQKRTLRPKPKITPKKKNVPKVKKVVVKATKPVIKRTKVVAKESKRGRRNKT
ncbi:hypothetical protein LCGC14_0844620 [marine sediment metagenome]|uniref:Uncharacterized protein n=1 Tax=marine sediment metagenome TaxID=412755 RepID=A0A0F9SJ77_9ZZZZ